MSKRTETGKVSTSFKIDKEIHKDLKVAAAREGREMGELVEDALTAYLRKHSK